MEVGRSETMNGHGGLNKTYKIMNDNYNVNRFIFLEIDDDEDEQKLLKRMLGNLLLPTNRVINHGNCLPANFTVYKL